ncbi:MAG: prepilin-type N-terminal cleavage/methylation domain-containing protein [Candidatus Thiodiazotropha sp. (ex Monitilora ramsayi)]|nr:prepilin-type N-terminal cleavage/methylation domain-containing protein [Candidatus Thiodiazotropha sp. (ex Monitilora ramsayi)]
MKRLATSTSTNHYSKTSNGFTLVEMMIALAVLSIISVIAIPAYIGYVEESRISSARINVEPLRLALEDFFLENGTYATGDWIPGGAQTLDANIGWHPDGDGDMYNYSVSAAAGGCAITTCYTVTVTHIQDAAATVTCNRNQAQGTFSCP